MEKHQKLAFCIASRSQPRRLKPANCLADDEDTSPRSTPAPRQFITEFSSSSKTQTTAMAPAIIAPLPNAHLFRRERPPLAGATDEGIVFTTERDDDPRSATDDGHAYGLNLPAAADKEAPPQVASTSELLRRRFKQDMAALSDHRDAEEHPNLSAKGFAAAVLAGYGWSEGQGIGRSHRNKGDTKVVSCGRRPAGAQAQRQTFGLGYKPSPADPRKARSGDWIVGGEDKKVAATEKKRVRQLGSRESIKERASSTRPRRDPVSDHVRIASENLRKMAIYTR